jgi:tRNA U34 5-methylaminomethyl-2-thiouridine-forming methyltransferase MnmC
VTARQGNFELVTLPDGVRAVRDTDSGEVMHPAIGPWREAMRLYVEQAQLAARLQARSEEPLRVYDIGLGGAANAVAALTCAAELPADARRPLSLVSFERDLAPLELALGDLSGFPFLAPWAEACRTLLARGRFEAPGIVWELHHGEVLDKLEAAPGPAHIVFHDPFSPETNPSLWTRSALARVRARMDAAGATLFTYSASTRTRVSLLLAGLFVGAGWSVASRSETTAASTTLQGLESPLGQRWLARWRRSSARAPHGEALTPALEEALLAHPQLQSLANA